MERLRAQRSPSRPYGYVPVPWGGGHPTWFYAWY
jgi:hypothetical protein